MKNLVLILSIGLNVALGVNYWTGAKRAEAKTQIPPDSKTSEKPAPTKKPTATNATIVTPAPVVATLDWHSVESDDYKQYIANLREIGCPEKTIRDIIRADVNELYRQKAKASGSEKRFEYWKPGNPMAAMFDEEQMSKDRAMAKEKRDLLKTLLGGDFPEETDFSSRYVMDPMQRMMDFLPPDKQAAMTDLEQEFAGKLMKTIKDASRGDGSAMKKILAEKDEAMLKILSPEEKFEYDLRLSQTSMMMRMGMGEFEPTEQEFRDLFKLQKQFDSEYGVSGFAGRGGTAPASAKEELKNQMKAILGEDRFHTYQLEQRWAFDPLQNIAKEHKVPKQTAFKVYDLQVAAESEAAKVRANQALSEEQRQAAMEAIRNETTKAVGEVLGAPASEDYLKKAPWLKTLR